MKKKKLNLTAIAIIGLTLSAMAQTSFKIEKIDSVSKTKSQIYSDTKIFIAEEWKSSKDVIQNDDKESGMIMIKAMTKQGVKMGMGAINEFWYSYNVKFFIKEGRCKILLDNVQYSSGPSSLWDNYAKALEPQEQDIFPGARESGLFEKNWIQLITSLKSEMKKIVDDYEIQIKKPSTINGDW